MNAEEFDFDKYLAQYDPVLIRRSSSYRRAVTFDEPLLFAYIYRKKALSQGIGEVTFADFHLDLAEYGKTWMVPKQYNATKGNRDIFVAPRNMGKSTWLHNILPLWAAAHGHIRIIAGFANASDRAKERFGNFKSQLDTNELLRKDYPELVTPLMRRRGFSVDDTQLSYRAVSGFAFKAFGVDGDALGMNIDDERPDLIILDDIEEEYSEEERNKRLARIRTSILPMEDRAHVVMVGTTLMPNNLIHQAVKSVKFGEHVAWIEEERFRVHHYKPILLRDDASERSCWPARWSLDTLKDMRGTRDYRMTWENDPMAFEGRYWQDSDFKYGYPTPIVGKLMSIDPAVTTTKKSNFTGIAVIGLNRLTKQCIVTDAEEVKLAGERLRAHVLKKLAADPEIKAVLIETNQGGENWAAILHHLPVKLQYKHQGGTGSNKQVRATRLLTYYQRGAVLHAAKLHTLEERMVAYDGRKNDDLIDAVGTGVEWLLFPSSKTKKNETVYQA